MVVADLDGVLDRLGTAVREEDGVHPVVTGNVRQAIHQPGRAGEIGVGAGRVEVLSRDFRGLDEIERRQRIEHFGVVVAQWHRADVAGPVHQDVTVHVGTEGADRRCVAVPDELVDVGAGGCVLVVVLDPLAGAFAGELLDHRLDAVTIHATELHARS